MDGLHILLIGALLFVAWRYERATTRLDDANEFLALCRKELEKQERKQRVLTQFNAESV